MLGLLPQTYLPVLIFTQGFITFTVFLYHILPSIKHLSIITAYQVLFCFVLYIFLMENVLQYTILWIQSSSDSILLTFFQWILQVFYLIASISRETLFKALLFYLAVGYQILYRFNQLGNTNYFIIAFLVIFSLSHAIFVIWPIVGTSLIRNALDALSLFWVHWKMRSTLSIIMTRKKSERVILTYSSMVKVTLAFLALKCLETLVSLLWREYVSYSSSFESDTSLIFSKEQIGDFFRYLNSIPVMFSLLCFAIWWHPNKDNMLFTFTQDIKFDDILGLYDTNKNLEDDQDEDLDLTLDITNSSEKFEYEISNKQNKQKKQDQQEQNKLENMYDSLVLDEGYESNEFTLANS